MDRLSQKIKNAQNFVVDKEGVLLEEVEKINDTLGEGGIAKEETVKEIFKNISLIKGDRGDNGKTPIKGKDYFTEEEIRKIKLDVTPIKGIDYDDGQDGYAPIKGKDYFTEKEIEMIIQEILKKSTPIKGKDYFTKTELELIKTEITPIKGEDYLTKDELREIIKEIIKKVTTKKNNFKKDIQEIKDEISTLKEKFYKSAQSFVMGGAGSHGREDLTSQCNGVLKVFTLASSYRSGTVTLFSTQFPIIYRPGVDFTESADKQITLTSEVGAPATGQTLICAYEKP